MKTCLVSSVLIFISTCCTALNLEAATKRELSKTRVLGSLNLTQQHDFQSTGGKRLLLYSIFVKRADKAFSESVKNLRFFLKQGVFENNGVDYVFLTIQGSDRFVEADHVVFPKFSNVRVLDEPNKQLDTCLYGHVLQKMDISSYGYFAFMNVGTRGPFTRQTDPHWLDQFVNKLSSHNAVMIGSTVSCEISPHVQTHFAVMDKRGVLKARDRWLHCPMMVPGSPMSHTRGIMHTEVGLSKQLLNEGFSISSITASEKITSQSTPKLCQQIGHGNPTFTDLDPYRYVVLKFGGEVMRQNLLSRHLVTRVQSITHDILG